MTDPQHRYDSWLIDFVNTDNLASTDLELDNYACIDAVDMVSGVDFTSTVIVVG